jgi:asparagine synthase (glutamine-hydrolysing)
MSIIFGMRKQGDTLVSKEDVLRLGAATARYRRDSTIIQNNGRIGMGIHVSHSYRRSPLGCGPLCDPRGNLISIDGRLDNYKQLSEELQMDSTCTSDTTLMLGAFLKWGSTCFSRFTGDWSLALWSADEEALYLARDHAGTRSLYFFLEDGVASWSTYLEGIANWTRWRDIDDEYVALYLGALPAGDLTPYKGIRAVRPAHYVVIKNDAIFSHQHWQSIRPARTIYQSDGGYEEHFISLFRQSVERRDDQTTTTLAHLSGGMDSASIVCMSDVIRRSRDLSAPLIDTLSFFDDSEPAWNERPYFSEVEEQRGKVGIHLEVSLGDRRFGLPHGSEALHLLPGFDDSTLERDHSVERIFTEGGYRAVLSGIGGDETLGGVPTPLPELSELLWEREFVQMIRRSIPWCIGGRTPVLHMLLDTLRHTCMLYFGSIENRSDLPAWLSPRLREQCIAHCRKARKACNRSGVRPTAITNDQAWWAIMETLPHMFPGTVERPEYRYPYLDKDLVEFLFSVPRTQLVRPGRRRSLMRRALKGIVPEKVLERRRKGYVIRGPLSAIRHQRSEISALLSNALIGDRGFVDVATLQGVLAGSANGTETKWWQALVRSLSLEIWLRHVQSHHEIRLR